MKSPRSLSEGSMTVLMRWSFKIAKELLKTVFDLFSALEVLNSSFYVLVF